MSDFDDVLTRTEVEFLAGLMPWISTEPEMPPICDEHVERPIRATVKYLGSFYCSECAAEYVNTLPVLAFAGTPQSRRERHNAARRAA